MESSSFIFYKNWYEGIEQMPKRLQAQAYRAVMRYGLFGEEPAVTENWAIRALFSGTIKKGIDDNVRKYEKLRRRRSEAGKKGMASRWNSRTITNDNKNNNVINVNNKMITKITSDNINDNVNVNDNDNDISSSSGNFEDADATKKEKRDMANALIDFYNAEIRAKGARLRICQSRTDERLSRITARVEEYGEERVRNVIGKAVASRCLNYELRIAPVDIEWIMRPRNFPNILEGKYDNRNHATKNSPGHYEGENARDAYAALKAQLKREGR